MVDPVSKTLLVLKSLFYQSNLNKINMQGTGFAWLARPMLKKEGVILSEAQSQRLHEYFNTNPSFVTLIVGIFVKEMLEGKNAFTTKAIYSAAFAALGDSFYWHALRPTLFLIALCLCVNLTPAGIVIYPIIFSSLHLSLLAVGYPLGRRFGEHTILLFNRVKFTHWANITDGISLFCLGGFLGGLLTGGSGGYLPIVAIGAGAFAVGALLYRRVKLNIFLLSLIIISFAMLVFCSDFTQWRAL
jgi:mannose/fructose/N-acetylgalactosamine-specific phosphotransferase system component IID